jgi:hypothetical protein
MIIANLDGWRVVDIPDVVVVPDEGVIESEPTVDDDDVVGGDEVSTTDETTATTNDESTTTDEPSFLEEPTTTTTEESTNTTTTTTANSDINPFMTSEEATTKANKQITDAECKIFYEEALDQAYMHTNRLNIDDLTPIEARMFIRGVCKWAASNLWNKYNIRVNNEDMEDTYIQSYGGLLYKSALKTLQQFVNQRIVSMTSISEKNNENNDDDIWIV